MRITFVMASGFSLTGGDRVIAGYAERLQQRGHEVLVVSPDPNQPTFKQQVKSILKGEGWLKKHHKQQNHFDRTMVPCKLLKERRPIVDSDVPDADVVVATWWETAEWVARLSPRKGAKTYFVQGYEVFDNLPKARVEATYSFPMYKITVSHWLRHLLQTRYGVRDICLIPNSVDRTLFQAPPRGKQDTPTVGVIYTYTHCKGTDISLKAFELAAQRIPDLRLVVFGAKPTADIPLPSKNVEYVYQPPQDLIPQLYAQCDAWLVGSREEGFGLPILEAMACRTPVIACPAGAAPELLQPGGGMLLKSVNSEEMAQAIEQVCQMSAVEWQRMSDLAYATVAHYNWDHATDLFEAALQTSIEYSKQQLALTGQTHRKLC
ncbi:glycosyltransferase family 4 protein [Pantanalinema rosaneae CENA516]|uniref:glycosyltransferase family 4 protein n=1 Tax=Pantanalinema rosaneae TaxID=1620701 RepID=UPI003D6E0AE0